MRLLSEIKDDLSDVFDFVDDRIDDATDALKVEFDDKSDRFWNKVEATAPYAAFFVTAAASDLEEWFGDNRGRVEKTIAKLEIAAEDAYVEADGNLNKAVRKFLKSDAFEKAEDRLKDLVEQVESFDPGKYVDDIFA